MIAQHDWDAAMQSDHVRTTARLALVLLNKHGLQETPSSAEIDWALGEVLAGESFSPADYYAAFFHVLNPWMLEVPTKAEKERNYRLDIMRAWERRWERYLMVLLQRHGGKARFTFEDLAHLDEMQLSARVSLDGARAEVSVERVPQGDAQ